MANITIETKNNGYMAEEIQDMIKRFEKAAGILFPGCTIHHFYYGNTLDMADIILENKHYGQFNISKSRVGFNGHTCTMEELKKFESMTHNDECYKGKRFEIAK